MSATEIDSPATADPASIGSDAGPTVPRMILGMRLRQLREVQCVSQHAAAEAIRASRSKICRLELGRTGSKPRDIADLLTLYGVTDEAERAMLLELAGQANLPGWWQPYSELLPDGMSTVLGMEQSAQVIRSYDAQLVPALLQSADYARAEIELTHRGAAPRDISRRVELRLRRQQVLHRSRPVQFWAVIDEAALRRAVGGPDVMRAQLTLLSELAALPHITVQILPFSAGGHSGLGGSLTLLRLPGEQLPDLVYLEQVGTAALLDRKADSDHYWDIVNHLAVEADLPEDTGRTLGRLISEI